MNSRALNFSMETGLIPAVIQNAETGKVLMVGYMNEEAYSATERTRRVTFFSRSKNRLWVKGESSGNELFVQSIVVDCDNDAILIQALPAGPTCHTGRESCFDGNAEDASAYFFGSFLRNLSQTIRTRNSRREPGSYTAELFSAGLDRIIQKVGEESVEVLIAGKNNDAEQLIEESADLLYHLMVLLEARGLSLDDVEKRLKTRSS